MSEEPRVDGTAAAEHYWDLLKQQSYSPEEAAEVLNLPKRLILTAAFGGDLKAEIISGDVIDITRTDLVAWLLWRERH